MIGEVISHYRIVDKLGEGGMGVVYLAEDTTLKRKVALKVLPADMAAAPGRLARFRREAESVAALNHPNIVTIHSIETARVEGEGGETSPIHFLTMELLEGDDLTHKLTAGPVPLSSLLEIVTPIAEALAAAHEQGIVHRDLKPGNVMVTRDGRVKVLDFGLAKEIDTVSDAAADTQTLAAALTAEGTILGTPAYMSPEQVRAEAVDARSDLFALGLITYELATGSHPLLRKTPMETASAILMEAPPPVTERLPQAPPLFAHMVSKLLAKDRDSRYQTARGLLTDLEALAAALAGDRNGLALERDRFSIAVLPFANMSADPENDFLADGLAEDLINELARIEGVKVVARTSAFQFRGRELDIREIGDKLGVGTVLEGSVRAAGNRLRVSAQVVNVEDGYHVWSERFDRERADIFDIQDEITAAICERIRVTLGDERQTSDILPTPAAGRNPEAHAAFLKGRHRMVTLTPGGLESARRYFEQALAIEPEYADAHAALSWLAINQSHFGGGDPKPLYEEARGHARRALEISDAIADAHGGLAFVYMYGDWDWAASEESFKTSVDLAPSSALLRLYYACLLSVLGRHDEAVAEGYRAQQLDPLAGIVNGAVGLTLNGAGRYEEAKRELTRGIELEPDYWLIYCHRAVSHHKLGDFDRAAADNLAGWERSRDPWALAGLICDLEKADRADEAAKWLVVFEEMADSPFMRPLHRAMLHLGRGELDEGFSWLERSLDARDSLVPWVPESPFFSGTAAAADPRFAAARARLGIERQR